MAPESQPTCACKRPVLSLKEVRPNSLSSRRKQSVGLSPSGKSFCSMYSQVTGGSAYHPDNGRSTYSARINNNIINSSKFYIMSRNVNKQVFGRMDNTNNGHCRSSSPPSFFLHTSHTKWLFLVFIFLLSHVNLIVAQLNPNRRCLAGKYHLYLF